MRIIPLTVVCFVALIPTRALALTDPGGLCRGIENDRLWVTSPTDRSVELYAASGKRLQSLPSEEFEQPIAVAASRLGRVAVCDAGHNAVLVFSQQGQLVLTLRIPGATEGIPAKPKAAAFDWDGNLFVLYSDIKQVVVFPPEKSALPGFALENFDNPAGICTVRGGRIAVSDSKRGFVQSFSVNWAENKLVPETRIEGLSAPGHLAADAEGKIFVCETGANQVRSFTPDGKVFGTFLGRLIGGIAGPVGIAQMGDRVAISDSSRKRIVVFFSPNEMKNAKKLYDPEISITRIAPNEAILQWDTAVRALGSIEYGATEDLGQLNREKDEEYHHKIHLKNLAPGKRFMYRVRNAIFTFPEQSYSELLQLATDFEGGRTWMTTLPVSVLVYGETTYRDKYPKDQYPNIPDGAKLTSEQRSALDKCLAGFREFYFRNSGCKINLKLDVYDVPAPLTLGEAGGYLGPTGRVEHDFEAAAASFGRKPEEYSACIALYAWQNWADDATGLRIKQDIGGGTYGVDGPWKYKRIGYCGIPLGRGFGAVNQFILIHEFHHAFDSMMWHSGHPGYPHADIPGQFMAQTGEGWDFNARILRSQLTGDFASLKFGYLDSFADADKDGMPDDDSSLPNDEARFRSSPAKADTDDDRWSDLQEYMAENEHATDPNNKDTDADTRPDNKDTMPLLAVAPLIPKGTVELDGRIAGMEWSELGSVPNATTRSTLSATFYANLDNNRLAVGAVSKERATLILQIDAAADGWFHGTENLEVRVTPRESGRGCDVEAQAIDRTDSKQNLQLLFGPQDVFAAASKQPDGWHIECIINANAAAGLQVRDGVSLPLRLALQRPREWWMMGLWYANPDELAELAERDRFLPLRIEKSLYDPEPRPIVIESFSVGAPVAAGGALETRNLKIVLRSNIQVGRDCTLNLALPAGWTLVKPLPEKIGIGSYGRVTLECGLVISKDASPGRNEIRCGVIMREKETDFAQAAVYVQPAWRVLGPFAEADIAKDFGPEVKLDFNAKYGEAAWTAMDSGWDVTGTYLDYPKAKWPKENFTAYLALTVVSQGEKEAVLRMGSGDAYAVWLNGAEVLRQPTPRDRGAYFGQDAAQIRLADGVNHVLIKVAVKPKESRSTQGFFWQLCGPDLEPLKGVYTTRDF